MARYRRYLNISPDDHCGLDKDAFEMVVVKNGDGKIIK